MGAPFAEVIGDPVSHSKSPLIHLFWLHKLGMPGDYRTVRLSASELPAYLASRRRDVHWRGCNVTAPLKQVVTGFVGSPPNVCRLVGAVNCVTRTPLGCLVGTNTDLDGVGEALSNAALEGAHIFLIGAGGAARAATCYLLGCNVGRITIIARNRLKAEALTRMKPDGSPVEIVTMGFDDISESSGPMPSGTARIVINATPMGRTGGEEMDSRVLGLVEGSRVVFDMVYDPAETTLLSRARSLGVAAVDGFAMLIGQAAPAFELFFGVPAPRQFDAELRELLIR